MIIASRCFNKLIENNMDYLYYIIHKPYGVLSQFTDEDGNPGLGSVFNFPKDVYPVGRLDKDSEGLLLITNDKSLNNQLLNPKFMHWRSYWIEVEGRPSPFAMSKLETGVEINLKGKMHRTAPAKVKILHPQPIIAERNPPVNYLKHPERTWIEIKLREGKNRQVRKMTALVGHPTLRLIRVAIEGIHLDQMQPGEFLELSEAKIRSLLFQNQRN
jgi:23S rRNA pseudouridine2457 synthase